MEAGKGGHANMTKDKGIAIKCLDCGRFMIPDTSNGSKRAKFEICGFIWEYWKCLKCHKEITTRRQT